MPTTEKKLRVLIVDNNRDGADALGLLVEALGNQAHVTYGGAQALEVATAFRPDLMFVDLLMPGVDGCELVMQFRQELAFANAKIVAITGLTDEKYAALAKQAGFDAVLFKPATLTQIKAVLASVVPEVTAADRSVKKNQSLVSVGDERRLPLVEARRIRNERISKNLTQAESEAAICYGIIRFQEEYLGWRSQQVHAHFIKDLLVIRIDGVLALAERQLAKSLSPEKGRDLIKQTRNQLIELARPMLESLVHEAVGVKVLSMHHDISTVTGEEMVIFPLAEAPRFQ